MARPKITIDDATVLKLASIQCTMNEISAVVGCSVDTLERRFADCIKKGRDQGRASLRRLQWEAAQKGSNAMLIWLGKQLLGQTDRQSIVSESVVDAKVEHSTNVANLIEIAQAQAIAEWEMNQHKK